MPRLAATPYQNLVKVFEADGFTFRRQGGDHLIYIKPRVKRPLVIPMYRHVPVFIIKICSALPDPVKEQIKVALGSA